MGPWRKLLREATKVRQEEEIGYRTGVMNPIEESGTSRQLRKKSILAWKWSEGKAMGKDEERATKS